MFNPSHVLRDLTVDIKNSFSARTRPRHELPSKCIWISVVGKDLSPVPTVAFDSHPSLLCSG